MATPQRQAGKGSKPRPVKGDVYRDNWEYIFRKPASEKVKETTNDNDKRPTDSGSSSV